MLLPTARQVRSDRDRSRRRRSRRLRIAVIGPSRHPVAEPFAGGLEAFVHALVVGLRDHGHEVTLFAGRGTPGAHPGFPLDSGDWNPSEAARDDRSMPAEQFLGDHHQHLRLMLALGRELSGDFDVVHNHSLHHLPVAMSASLPVPVVTTLHTPPTPWLESAVALGGSGVAAWTAVSDATAQQWTRLRGQVRVVRNGVDLSRWPAGPGGDRAVWSGRLVPEKAPHLALRAARRAGIGIDLAGPVGDPRYVRETVRPLLGDGAEYLGHLDQATLAQVVGARSVALVTPVWEEPFGLVAAEAMACGTPVVAFSRGGLPEVVTPITGVLVAPDDVDAMARALPQAAALDRTLVRRTAARELSFRAALRAYESLYRELLGTAALVPADDDLALSAEA
jgi:glycosyltransferase involved in cell wall biosynthesis